MVWRRGLEGKSVHTHTCTHTCGCHRPNVCSHWLAQQKIWLSCKTYVLKSGVIKSKYIFQVREHTSPEEPREEGEKISFFPPVITFKVRAEIHLGTLVMLTYPDGSLRPVAKSPALETHSQLVAVMSLFVFNTCSELP